MKKFIANILILVAIACAGALVAWCATHDEESKAFVAQTETLNGFYAALLVGDWEKAVTFCDSTGMRDYIGNFKRAWNRAQKSDSSVLNIAKKVLAEGKITVLEQELRSEDDGCTVFRIDAGSELNKTKTAELRLTEGRWIITDIIAGK